jgi:hypothetical protein
MDRIGGMISNFVFDRKAVLPSSNEHPAFLARISSGMKCTAETRITSGQFSHFNMRNVTFNKCCSDTHPKPITNAFSASEKIADMPATGKFLRLWDLNKQFCTVDG